MKFILISTCLFLFFSCETPNETVKKNDIYRIVYAQGGCYDECPAEAFSVDSSLATHYRGVENVNHIGSFEGHINLEIWDEINAKCKRTKYHVLDSIENWWIDAQMHEIFIYDNSETKHIVYNSDVADAPDTLAAFTVWLRNIVLNSGLKPSSDSVKFETSYQFPPPIMDTVMQFREPPIQ